ncbi:MAG: prolipoprotein diacylglyceryl transferase [Gammaproteobacteria bacterium]|tara:strand:- start:1355 stop:2158 length:804 start_codon:yes stop_codon:yes gene_type:complete
MNIAINPIAFYVPFPFLGWWPVYWYGISWLIGILGIHWYAKKIVSNNSPFSKDDIEDFLFYGVLGAIIGGRLGYMFFYGIDQVLYNPLSIFKVWEGGLSFHGGLIGVLVSFLLFSRKLKINFFQLSDHIALAFPIGLGSVRIGNFLGGELLGRPTDLPWGMTFWSDPLQLSRHPSQLYQAFFEGFLLFIILFWLSKKPRPRMFISGTFLSVYGLFRIITEIFRMPDAHIGFDFLDIITRGQLLSIPMVLIGLLLLILSRRNKNETIS